jgi:gas vesicle protein
MWAAVLASAAILSSCAAAHTAISKRDLDVQSKMTDTVFLDPVPRSQQVVYLQVRNTSDQAGFDIDPDLRNAIEGRGYTITNDMARAHYLMQVNVLQVGKIDPSAADRYFAAGYGSAVGGAATGAVIGGIASPTLTGFGIGGIVGGAASIVADALVKDVTYSVITDVQISERSGSAVTERTQQSLRQGRSGTREVTATDTTNWKRYQTRVMSSANQANLELPDALPALKAGITRSIAGML